MKSWRCRAYTSGPLAISRHTAMGPPKRLCKPVAHRAIAFGLVRQYARLASFRAGNLSTEIVLPVGPVDSDQGCELMFGRELHRSPSRAVHCRRDMQSWALRSQYREPVRRRALSIRCRTQAHPRARIQTGEHPVFGSKGS